MIRPLRERNPRIAHYRRGMVWHVKQEPKPHLEHNTYIYRLNAQFIASSIMEADKMFTESTSLYYQPKGQKNPLHAWMSPAIAVEIVRDPMLREKGER